MITKEKIVSDLESIFSLSMEKKSYTSALKAKEIQSKILGFLKESKESSPISKKPIPENIKELQDLLVLARRELAFLQKSFSKKMEDKKMEDKKNLQDLYENTGMSCD